jgi:hypothetical protein
MMKYNREAEKEAKKEALRQAGYKDDLPQNEKIAALKLADDIFQEYLDECAAIEEEEEDFYRMSDLRYGRNRDAA